MFIARYSCITLIAVVLSALSFYPLIAFSQDYEGNQVDNTPPDIVIGYVSVSAISQNSVVVTWTTDRAANARVEYGLTTSYGTITPNTSVNGTSHSVTLSGLNPGTTYNYRVRSSDSNGYQTNSSNQTFTTSQSTQTSDTSAPVITSAVAGSISQSSATITWVTNEPSDTLVEYGTTVSYGSQTTLNPQMVTSHSATLTGLTSNVTYNFRVKSKDAAGNLATSANQTFNTTTGNPGTTADTAAPSTPTNLTVTNSAPSSISLSWGPSSDNVGVGGYVVQRCQGASCTNFLGVAVSADTAYTSAPLLPNTLYRFRVQAYDATYNHSIVSNIAESTTPLTQSGNDTTKPSTPTGLQAVPYETSIKLTWSASTDNVGVVGYKIFRNGLVIGNVAGTTYTLEGLIPETLYTLEVAAYDAAGNDSVISNSIVSKTILFVDTTPPTRPLNLSAAPFAVGTSASLTWTHATDTVGVAGYYIYRDGQKIASTTTNFFTATGLSLNARYTFEVAAFDAAQNISARSVSVVIVAKNGDRIAPSQPIGLTAVILANAQIRLTWATSTDATGVAGYNVFRNGQIIGNPTSNSFVDSYVTLPTTYTVEAFDAAGNNSGKGIPLVVSLPPGTTLGTVGKALITKDLTLGMQNSEVLLLQQTLRRLGFFPPSVTPDGYFGLSTSIAVRSFQIANPPLAVDGVAGASVRNLINNVLLSNSLTSPSPIAYPAVTPGAPVLSGPISRNLSFGMSGADISVLQQLLTNEGVYPQAIISGYYGALTEAAVQRFQAKYGIVSSGDPSSTGYGAIGPRTRSKINSMLGNTSTDINVASVSPSPAVISSKFSDADTVHANSAVNVRTEPSLIATVLGKADQYTSASVIGGPISADGYVWWRLEYSSGLTGWSAENFLSRGNPPAAILPPSPPTAPPPPPARPPTPIPLYGSSDSSGQIPIPQFPVGTKVYTSADLMGHSTGASCWTVIDGVVYDLTNWINQHPGGRSKILALCGIDGSIDFHAQHGTNAMQVNILQGFKVGPYQR
jgi:peptidoglycan hydrolase-like protein with peptidoglycan-binding domain/chitodextrinase